MIWLTDNISSCLTWDEIIQILLMFIHNVNITIDKTAVADGLMHNGLQVTA